MKISLFRKKNAVYENTLIRDFSEPEPKKGPKRAAPALQHCFFIYIFSEKFERIESQRILKEAELASEEEEARRTSDEGRNKLVLLVTHFNVFMYATCFFIQTGTLPVSSKQPPNSQDFNNIII